MTNLKNKLRISRRSVKDVVYQELKEKIIDGVFEPGEFINEEGISNELSLSRTPIREAMQRLEVEGMVIKLPNGRLQISPISIEEIDDLYDVREVLEGLIARQATQNINTEQLEELRIINENMLTSSKENRNDLVIKYGDDYHNLLYSVSNNKTTLRILTQLNDHIARYRRLAPKNDINRSQSAAMEHNEIFLTIEKRDYKRAEELMKKHIRNSKEAAIKSAKKTLR